MKRFVGEDNWLGFEQAQRFAFIEIRTKKGLHDTLPRIFLVLDEPSSGHVFGVPFADRVCQHIKLFQGALHPFPRAITGLHTAHHSRHCFHAPPMTHSSGP